MSITEFQPFQKDRGPTSLVFGYIVHMLQSVELHVDWDKTQNTLQFYRSEKALYEEGEKLWGAIQYEQDGDCVNFRFYRSNIRPALQRELERLNHKYRLDKIKDDGKPAISIAYKFHINQLENPGVHSFLQTLYPVLKEEMAELKQREGDKV